MLRLQALFIIPIFAILAGALGGERTFGTVGAWAESYWWSLIVACTVLFVLLDAFSGFALRCPWCDFRFGKALLSDFAFAKARSPIGYCPQCGKSLGERVDE